MRKLLERLFEPAGFVVDTEYAYRPLPDFEVWSADVACVRRERDESTEDWLDGSPELVIEVNYRSNTPAPLEDKARTTLAGQGAQHFWIVYPRKHTVLVYERSGSTEYGANDVIPVKLLPGANVLVSDIFASV